jgi:hypothetical protein
LGLRRPPGGIVVAEGWSGEVVWEINRALVRVIVGLSACYTIYLSKFDSRIICASNHLSGHTHISTTRNTEHSIYIYIHIYIVPARTPINQPILPPTPPSLQHRNTTPQPRPHPPASPKCPHRPQPAPSSAPPHTSSPRPARPALTQDRRHTRHNTASCSERWRNRLLCMSPSSLLALSLPLSPSPSLLTPLDERR